MAKILIIEDEMPLCQIYGAALCHADPGHELLLTSTGEEGVEAALRERPDLIILDLSLPVMPGATVARILSEAGILPDVPLIIASGLGEPAAEIAESVNAVAFLSKPFELDSMVRAVESALANAGQHLLVEA